MSNKPYILSVDDEQLNQEIIQDFLEDEFDIKVLTNGQACLNSVAEKMPDLILLDVNMNGLNGLETCQILRENEEYKNIPIIFVSALASTKEIQAGKSAGGDRYLTKPFDEELLKTTIRSMLN